MAAESSHLSTRVGATRVGGTLPGPRRSQTTRNDRNLGLSALGFLLLAATLASAVARVSAHVNFDDRNAFLLREIRDGHVGPGILGFELGSIPKSVAVEGTGSSLEEGGGEVGIEEGGEGSTTDPSSPSPPSSDSRYTRELTMTYGNGSTYRCVFEHLVAGGSREDVEKREAEEEGSAKRRSREHEAKRSEEGEGEGEGEVEVEEEEKEDKRREKERGKKKEGDNKKEEGDEGAGRAQEAAAKAEARAEAAAAHEAKRKKQQEEEQEAYFGDGLTIR